MDERDEVRRAVAMVEQLRDVDWRVEKPHLAPLAQAIRANAEAGVSIESASSDDEDVPPDEYEAPPAVVLSYHEMLAAAARALDRGADAEARRMIDGALGTVPDSARARRLLSTLLERMGDAAGAHRALAEAQSIDYSPELHERLECLKAESDAAAPPPADPPSPPPPAADLAELMHSDAMRGLMQNPQIMQMAQSLSGDPKMRAMVENLLPSS